MQDLLKGLNPEQAQAVVHLGGPLLILAGAGSGKTRVLTRRLAYLLDRGEDPGGILAITFTNKAAAEMRQRAETLVGPLHRSLWLGTFHSACVRILRRDIEVMGYRRNFSILDAHDQLVAMKATMAELGMGERPSPAATLAMISQGKNRLLDPVAFRSQAETFAQEMAARAYSAYQDRLRASNALDFDDLLMVTVQLLRNHAAILERYQDRFQHILVDEYQDTNHAQYVLVKLLAEPQRNLFVVGDSDQSIFGWRGADINNILDFERDYPEARVIKLEENYRSTQNILDAAHGVITHNRHRKEKRLWTRRGPGSRVVLHRAGDAYQEALFLVREMERLKRENNLSWSDFAVLYRTHALSRLVEERLVRENYPYTIVGGLKFYQRKEIKDLIAYLRVLANPRDDISFRRIANVPKRGIGRATLEKIEQRASTEGKALREALSAELEHGDLTGSQRRALEGLDGALAHLEKDLENHSVTDLLREVLDKTGYLEALRAEGTIEALGRIENVEELVSVAGEYERRWAAEGTLSDFPSRAGESPRGRAGLEDFLAEIALVSEVDEYDKEQDAVTLMTLHSAKGLEFPVVFIAGVEEGILPHSRSVDSETELEEERRLCFVGMTRARDLLYLSCARERTLFGAPVIQKPSRFLEETPNQVIDRRGWWEETSPGEEALTILPGDRVLHHKWGEGTVVSTRGEGSDAYLTIAFHGGGLKNVIAGYARLRKL